MFKRTIKRLAPFTRLVIAFSNKIRDDAVNALSAHSTFFIVLSFFPFSMLLLTAMSYLPLTLDSLPEVSASIFPTVIWNFISSQLEEIAQKTTGTLISATAIVALWSASKGIVAIMRGLNQIYGIRETRNGILLRIISSVYTLIFAVLIIFFLIIFVFGNQFSILLQEMFPFLTDLALFIISMRTAVGLVLMILFFILLYTRIPNRKSSFMKELPGAVLAAGGWLGFSFLYSFYIDNMNNFSSTYGSLTAIVLCMLWVYCCMYIVFIGAEVNAFFANPLVSSSFVRLFKKRQIG